MKLKNIDELLIAGGLSNLFYSIAYPIVHTITIQDINSNVMSLASLINCVIAMIITKIWLNHSRELYKTFGKLLILEVIAYAILTITFLIGETSPRMYFLWDAILSALITKNIICAGARLKSKRYQDEEREKFDNKTSFYCNLTSVIGYGFSWIITLPIYAGFICMFIGIAVDNIFYYKVFKNIK